MDGNETIQDACDELWMFEDAQDVYKRLKLLRLKLLKAPPASYDPSEAFLAVQGAALRFLPAQQHQDEKLLVDPGDEPRNNGQGKPESEIELTGTDTIAKVDSTDDNLSAINWSITEEALYVAVELACVCIGPAWRAQMFRRQQILALQGGGDDDHSLTSTQSTWALPSEVQPVGSVRSFSPMTATIHDATGEAVENTSYPSIPEVLPAAMLRFAASALSFFPDPRMLAKESPRKKELWDLRRKNIAAGQRQLVLGLCCEPHHREAGLQKQRSSDTLRWTIPGANELVGDMLLFWLRFAYPLDRIPRRLTQGHTTDGHNVERGKFRIDWWYVLNVTRAATDLVSTGWRPLPKTNVGSTAVRYLLEIAQSGIALLDPTSTLVGVPPVIEVGVKEELIAALSSAAEAISALASLGSRGLIPLDSQKLTARTICRLHVVSGLMKASVIGVFPVGANQNNRSHSLHSAPEQEKYLSQIESCFADTADFLWMLLGTRSSSANAITALMDTFDAANPGSEKCSLFSTAGWDARKKLVCMEAGTALRMTFAALWERHPGGFSTSHLRVYMGKGLSALRSLMACVRSKIHELLGADHKMDAAVCDLLSLALDTVVALGHFVDRQLAGVGDCLSTVDWEKILLALQEAYAAWDDYSTIKSDIPGLQSIMEQAHLEWQSLMLRMGAFLDKCLRTEGSPLHSVIEYETQRTLHLFILRTVIPSMEPLDAELLGITTFRAWIKFAFFPFRSSGWAETCTEILEEAFSVYENKEHIHSPQVRAQALRSLTLDSGGDKVPQVSMLTMSRDVGDIHDRVVPYLISILQSILSDTSVQPPAGRVVTLPAKSGVGLLSEGPQGDKSAAEMSARNMFLLESYAVKLAGRLVREVYINAQDRSLLIGLLRTAALDSRWPGIGRYEHAVTTRTTQDPMEGAVRLAAATELSRCFAIPFGNFPLLHEIVPQIMDALHAIIVQYTNSEGQFDSANPREGIILVAAALVPLCRLRTCSDGKTLCLLPSSKLARHAPPILEPILGSSGQDNDRVLFAPLVEVAADSRVQETVDKPSISSKKTMISLGPAMSAMILTLVSTEHRLESAKDDSTQLIRSVSTICLHSLTSFLLSGFPLYDHEKFQDLVHSVGGREADDSRWEERASALAVSSEIAFARLSTKNRKPDESGAKNTAATLFHHLLTACQAGLLPYVASCSRALIAILPAIADDHAFDINGESLSVATFSHSVQALRRELPSGRDDIQKHAAVDIQILGSFLAVMHDILGEVRHDLPQPLLLEAFGVCMEIMWTTLSQSPNHSLFIAIRCLNAIVARLHTDTIETRLSGHNSAAQEPVKHKDGARSAGMIGEFAGELETELLHFRRLLQEDRTGDASTNSDTDCHEALALEVERIESFEVATAHGLPVKASWLCGKSILLTCRVGAPASRQRGWVEIVVRSSTFRKRVMVRLLSKFSTRNPDFPSLMWSPSTEPSLKMEDPAEEPTSLDLDGATDSILDTYNRLVGRFDSLIAANNPDDTTSQFTPSVSSNSTNQGTGQLPGEQSILDGKGIQAGATSGGRIVVAEMSTQDAVPGAALDKASRSELLLAETSIKTWLEEVLEDQHSVRDVSCALARLEVPVDGDCQGSDLMMPIRRLRGGAKLDRAIAMLNRIIPMNTHKIALLYAGPKRIGSEENDLESSLLATPHGSPAYHAFAEGLGVMVPTKQLRYFSAGLDVSNYESDGRYTRVWVGGLDLPASKSVVVYHAIHLMPQGLNNRKRHVGNDNVLIVFVDKDSPLADDINIAAHELNDSVVSGHFGFVTIYVLALPESGLVRVSVRLKHQLPDELRQELRIFVGDDVVATQDAPEFVRSIAIRTDLACRSILDSLPPPCNCYERYQILRGMERLVVN